MQGKLRTETFWGANMKTPPPLLKVFLEWIVESWNHIQLWFLNGRTLGLIVGWVGGGGGWGIWRDFLERAEAVALLRPLSTTIQTYSMASDHSLVTTLLAQSLIFKIWQSGKASCWTGCIWRQYKSLKQHIWRLSVNRMPFSGQKPPPKPIKCVRKVTSLLVVLVFHYWPFLVF